MSQDTESIRKMTQTAILIALTCIFSYLMIPVAGLEICLAPLVILIGAVMLGTKCSTLLGSVFGLISFLLCVTGQSAFGALLFAENPFFTFIVCVPTRAMMGFLVGAIYSGIRHISFHTAHDADATVNTPAANVAVCVASVSAPVMNTFFFMTALLLLFVRGETMQAMIEANSLTNLWSILVFLAGINAIVETAVCTLIGAPIAFALIHYRRRHV